MIKYLQHLRRRKGFTMVELIIVIAIIGILATITIPMFTNDDAQKQAADIYASDFYASLQYTMTRYQTTDYHLSPAMKTETSIIKYDPAKLGNVITVPPVAVGEDPVIYIEGYSDNGLQYIHVGETFGDLMIRTQPVSRTEFEKLIEKDMREIINQSNDGYYYAKVTMDSYNNLKVLSAHYCNDRFTILHDDLMFVDYGILNNGLYCGTCSNVRDSQNRFIGDIGTYVLNLAARDFVPSGNIPA